MKFRSVECLFGKKFGLGSRKGKTEVLKKQKELKMLGDKLFPLKPPFIVLSIAPLMERKEQGDFPNKQELFYILNR
ncbi:MAG: hypothetical protein DYG98_12885 [Haliscomenobacteraceae bacterium CHB4]|nr:hypothetical protein [Haliscomenobacteraceae bacterium CHB4]